MDQNNFNIQTEFHALRQEIRDGFEKIHGQFDAHALSDTEKFAELKSEVRDLKEDVGGAKKGLYWTITTVVSAAIMWFFK